MAALYQTSRSTDWGLHGQRIGMLLNSRKSAKSTMLVTEPSNSNRAFEVHAATGTVTTSSSKAAEISQNIGDVVQTITAERNSNASPEGSWGPEDVADVGVVIELEGAYGLM